MDEDAFPLREGQLVGKADLDEQAMTEKCAAMGLKVLDSGPCCWKL